jgi:PEP-CTERM putative exosortase interaction domain
MKQTSLTSLAILLAACSASAENMLFNFGYTSRIYTGTNSPGHSAGDSSGTNWFNVYQDINSGVKDENGNATDLVLDFGTTTTDFGTTLDFSASTNSANYNMSASVDAGLATLFDTNLGEGNAVRGGSGSLGIGLSITGLDAGEYVFYVTAFRGDTASGAERDFNIFAGVSSDAITDFSSYSIGTITNTAGISEWTVGDNYIKGSFTIDGVNDTFSLLSNSDSYIGVLTSLEIIAVPEPSVFGLLAGLGSLTLVATRRRR